MGGKMYLHRGHILNLEVTIFGDVGNLRKRGLVGNPKNSGISYLVSGGP